MNAQKVAVVQSDEETDVHTRTVTPIVPGVQQVEVPMHDYRELQMWQTATSGNQRKSSTCMGPFDD
jgi:hypothetical protein